MKFTKSKLVLAGVALLGAQAVWAVPVTGQTILVSDTVGRQGSGGPFLVSGGTYSGPSFETFCLELNEFLSLGGVYTITTNSGAVNGGVGSAATYGGDVAGTATYDPLSKASGWLYGKYLAGGAGLTGWTGSNNDKQDVQTAIWYLENEIGATTGNGNAATWYTQAIGAAPSYTQQFQVMNLTDGANLHQDLLSPIPEPETYAMMLAGLGLMGFIGRRRKQKEAAAA